MAHRIRWSWLIVVVGALLLTTGLLLQASPAQVPEAVGGFLLDGTQVNAPETGASSPDIALGHTGPEGAAQPWIAFAQQIVPTATRAALTHPTDIGAAQVVVAAFDKTTQRWEPRGEALALDTTATTRDPALAFGGPNHSEPWVALSQNPIDQPDQGLVMVAHYTQDTWQFVGAGNSEFPSLNRNADQPARNPALAVGRVMSESQALPWVAWDEVIPNGPRRIMVSRAISESTATGGYRWEPETSPPYLGDLREGIAPEITFSGPDHAVAWVTWFEVGGSRPQRLFAARTVSDTTGLRWQVVGPQPDCGNDEVACALAPSANHAVTYASLTSGLLPGESEPTPWIALAVSEGDAPRQILVLRLDPSNPNRFLQVGESLNTSAQQGTAEPDIVFVGNVPHVTWSEIHEGVARVYVSHLADTRPGFERWDLDTSHEGLDLGTPGSTATDPSIGTDGLTPYITWVESEGITNTIRAAHRYPEGPAWGTSYPPFIRCVGNPYLQGIAGLDPMDPTYCMAATLASGAPLTDTVSGWPGHPIVFTSSCDHVHGWEHIREIHFKLSDAQGTIFVGRYVAPSTEAPQGQLFVEDPQASGSYLGGGAPGSGDPIETEFITFYPAQTTIVEHGPSSPALDVRWALSFKRPALFRNYTESINIIYASEADPNQTEATDFFRIPNESFFTGIQRYIPLVVK